MRIVLIGLLFSISLAACGTKGPLYIPEKQYPLDPAERKAEQKSPKQDNDQVP
ncbi:LPS translocon maturation chaperone LptM [Methylovorus mays]|uniref:LPS translocon maturation chaperone LptM n=1 Tax=Methylovorus mays TaxID=184077 RepID=UPI001E5B8378|nr:lipoprotein [Methylovorus mays]MCB5208109.1 lipoprotein [Methylovorus mays]